jgi:hypothetical protein
VDAEQPLGRVAADRIGDGGAHVAALGDITGVAEAMHQLRPGLRDAADVPAKLGRLAGEAVAGQGRQHEVERVLGAPAVRGRVGERADDLEQLDDRAGPAVRHDQRQRVRVRRPHVDFAAIRRRSSASSSSGTSIRNGRTGVAPAGFSVVTDMCASQAS